MSTLSEDEGVNSPGGLVGLEDFEDFMGDEVIFNFLKGSLVGWKRDKGLFLYGVLSCKLALRCRGVVFRKFGYWSIADVAQCPEKNFILLIFFVKL